MMCQNLQSCFHSNLRGSKNRTNHKLRKKVVSRRELRVAVLIRMKGVEMTRKKQKSPKSVCFGIKNQIESLSFEGTEGAPLVLGYVLI
jgi:hypothetical protein